MNSIIETQRQAHEEIESYEQALAEVLMQNPTTVSRSAKIMLNSSGEILLDGIAKPQRSSIGYYKSAKIW